MTLRGQIDLILDIGKSETLELFVRELRNFVLPSTVRELARRLAIRRPVALVRSAAGLQKQLLHPQWRMMPVQFDLPSKSQVFGRIVAAAIAHGILYPSVRGGAGRCLALFPQNWKGSASFVEVMDPAPVGATLTRIDGSTTAY